MNWQPIWTAPRDRTLRLYDSVLKIERTARWNDSLCQWICDTGCAIRATHWREIEQQRKDGAQ